MSAVKEYLAVALLAVSLGACYPHTTRPTQLATPRPEDVRIRLGPRPVASDTLGRDNPIGQDIETFLEIIEKGPLYAAAPSVRDKVVNSIKGPLKANGLAKGGRPSPRHPRSEFCSLCTKLVTKRR